MSYDSCPGIARPHLTNILGSINVMLHASCLASTIILSTRSVVLPISVHSLNTCVLLWIGRRSVYSCWLLSSGCPFVGLFLYYFVFMVVLQTNPALLPPPAMATQLCCVREGRVARGLIMTGKRHIRHAVVCRYTILYQYIGDVLLLYYCPRALHT